MRRHRHSASAGHERWLISYADFITLLFAFFVVLFASGQADKKRKSELAVAMKSAFQQDGTYNPHSLTQAASAEFATEPVKNPAKPILLTSDEIANQEALRLQQRIRALIRAEVDQRHLGAGLVTATISPEGLVISMHDGAFFDSGAATVRTSSLPVLVAMLSALPHRPMRVEGHTDDRPIHSVAFPTNWELSTARAATITRLLLTQHTIEPGQVSAAGYAEFHPIADNTTPEGRSQNRRVDIIILKNAATTP